MPPDSPGKSKTPHGAESSKSPRDIASPKEPTLSAAVGELGEFDEVDDVDKVGDVDEVDDVDGSDDSDVPDLSPSNDDPQQERHVVTVNEDEAGDRLDRFLASRFPEFSRSRLSQLIEEGKVTVDDSPSRPAARVRSGATVELLVPAPIPETPQAEDLPLSILYEDSDVVVIDKAAGMVVHPAAGVHSGTLVNALLHHVTDLSVSGDEPRPGIVHRLDKDTSGALVVAKNDVALAALQRQFQERRVERAYVALVHGIPPASGTIDTPFGRHPVDRTRMTGRIRDADAETRRAITHFTVAETFGNDAALLHVKLETGRTHQIRVHLSESNHPLLGDEAYGGTKRDKRAAGLVRQAAAVLKRQALHALRLSFEHPRNGKLMTFEAPLPEEMERAIEILRKL